MAQSKMYNHCVRVYDAMVEQSYVDSGNTIYRGFLSNLIQYDLNLPLPYYTTIKRTLEELGCIEQLKRGGGTAPSEWQLYSAPDQHLFDQSKQFDTGLRKNSSKVALEQAIASLNSRLLEVERQVRDLVEEVHDGNRGLGDGEPLSEVQ